MNHRAHAKTGLIRLLLRRFRRSERGVTAIEFAILGPVFFALIGATLETALVFFAGHTLDSAVHDSSRLIRTGQIQGSGFEQSYRSAVCGRMYNMFDCDALQISVTNLGNFSHYEPSSPIDENTGEWLLVPRFDSVWGNDVVLVEAYYKWPTIFNIPGLALNATADGRRLLATARVFRNEPF